jgi:serine phosphatase RsbU (regulator of sigma subunit)
LDENWSAITSKNEAPYGNLPHGAYTFKVKAMNSEGYWSKPFEYKFNIRPPFWKTWWFRTLIGLLIISSIWYYIKSREKKLVARQQQLEKTVEERTEELVQKNIVVEQQKNEVEAQKHLIEEKHKEITDSINYAERIQRSFLASKEMLDENLKEHFVFFQPKDVVSGDFYWATSLNNKFAIVTADSTGHGVPGAIMSLLNITSLETALKDGYKEPSDIFNATRKTIIERLKKDGSEQGGKDGMDASLICFDFENNKFTYAAANNPIWIVRNNELLELKPDKMPVGKHDRDFESFTQHEFDLQKGDVVYTLTDGMPDQFGGPKGKKFMYKQLKELLVSIAHEPMGKQKQILTDSLNTWKGDLEQVDDVCLIGVRV